MGACLCLDMKALPAVCMCVQPGTREAERAGDLAELNMTLTERILQDQVHCRRDACGSLINDR